jgi:tetratricopeptide (TPR) repeat protein
MKKPTQAAPTTLTFAQAVALADEHLAGGRLAQAEDLCRRVLAVDPAHAPALHLLGIVAYRAGNLSTAIALLKRATAADPTAALYLCNLCEMCRLAGDLDPAFRAGQQAVALAPGHPQALNNLGIVHFERREYEQAEKLYRGAVAVAPDYAEAHNNLGNVLRTTRQYDKALPAYRRALELRPAYADAINNMGTTLRDTGRLAEAEIAYRRALALNPASIAVLTNLALAVKDLDRLDEAAAILDRVRSLEAGNVQALTYLALTRLDQGRVADAEVAARRALALRPDDAEALNALGQAHQERGELSEALALYRRAVARKDDLADAHNNIGNVLKELGELDEARAAHARAVELDPYQAGFYVNLGDGKTFRQGDPHLARMEELARGIDTLSPEGAMQLHFALGKAYDDLGRHEQAFPHFLEATARKRAKISYDEAGMLGLLDRIRAAFDSKLMTAAAHNGDPSTLPVFVLGMPRSGTTLVEQIIASHPSAHGAGELPDLGDVIAEVQAGRAGGGFPEFAGVFAADDWRRIGSRYVERLRGHSPAAERVTDKMPSNYLLVGLIHLALPQARIIHVMRDPIDTCLSCFTKLFKAELNYTYDLGELGRYYRGYARLMAHWRQVLPAGRMLEIRYEEVVADLEGSARRLVDHCGLDWDARCLAFHQTRRPVRTASAAQVRRPIYTTSQGRSHAYRQHLGPLIEALGDCASGARERSSPRLRGEGHTVQQETR